MVSEGICDGVVVNTSDIGHCMCECYHGFHFSGGINSRIGYIVGIHFTDAIIASYLLFFFIVLLTIFFMCHHILDHCIENIKALIFKPLNNPRLSRCYNFVLLLNIPESGLLIILGIIIGLLLWATRLDKILKSEVLTFNEEIFFLFLIPPIIFEAGYNMSLKSFHSNFALILSHAIIGTVGHFVLLGMILFGLNKAFGITDLTDLEIFIYAALISAVDPVSVLSIFKVAGVNERLNILVGAESMLNDAVSIVLYRMFVDMGTHSSDLVVNPGVIGLSLLKFIYVSCFGSFVGVFFGIVAVSIMYFNRRINAHQCDKDHSHYHKMTIILGFSFLAYFVAESTFSSGIIAILFCGIIMNAFGKKLLVPHVRKTCDIGLHVFAQICESLVFMYLGIDLIIYSHNFNWRVILISNFFIFSFRFMCVYLITYSYNVIMFCLRHRPFIPFKDTFIHAFSGIRGAIAFALAFMIPHLYFDLNHKDEIVTNSFSVILFTIFFQGTVIGALIGLLGIKKKKRTVRGFVKDLLKIMKYLTKMSLFLPPYGIHVEAIQEEVKLPRVDDEGVAIDIDAKVVDDEDIIDDPEALAYIGESYEHVTPSQLRVVTGPISSSHPIFGTIFEKDFVKSFKKLKIVLDTFEMPKLKKPTALEKHEKKEKKKKKKNNDDDDESEDDGEEFNISRPGTLELKSSPTGEFYVLKKEGDDDESENENTNNVENVLPSFTEKKEINPKDEFVFLTDVGDKGTAIVKSRTFEDGIEFIEDENKKEMMKKRKRKKKKKKKKKEEEEEEEESSDEMISGSTASTTTTSEEEELEEGGEEKDDDDKEEKEKEKDGLENIVSVPVEDVDVDDVDVNIEQLREMEERAMKELEMMNVRKKVVKKKKKKKKKRIVTSSSNEETTTTSEEEDNNNKDDNDDGVVIDITASPSANLISDVYRSETLTSIGRSQSAEYLMKPSTTSHYISLSQDQSNLKLLIAELKKFVNTKDIDKLIQDPEILKEQRYLILSFQRDMAYEIEKLFSLPESPTLDERLKIPSWQKRFSKIMNFL